MSDNSNAVPTFTPPSEKVPSFTPPSADQRSFSGPACYYHRGEQAVATCARCGKHLCDDCYEAYGVDSGEYANKALCYDCSQQLVAENVQELTENKKTIKRQFILSIVGMSIGLLLGLIGGLAEGNFGTGLLAGIIGAGIGGIFLTFMKFYFSLLWQAVKAVFSNLGSGNFGAVIVGITIGILFQLAKGAIQAIYYTIKNTIEYVQYIKRTSGFIESDTEALEQMRQYMEYTRIRDKNKGVDLETLMSQGSELYNNSFARMVRDQGEEAATEAISRAATRIAENGEIIRDFAA